MAKNTKTPERTDTRSQQQAAQVSQTTGATEQVVVTARPLNPPEAQPKMGSTREVHDRHRKALAEGRAQMEKDRAPVNTGDAKIIPNIGQPRAQTSEEMRQDAEDSKGGVAQAAPYPGDPHEAHVKAILASERQRDSGEFNTEDLTGTSVDGDGKTDTVKVRLLYDWWDGQGVRHPLNSEVEVAMNDARNLLDQRKAERTDPLRPSRR
ncbi:hypothetical protein [uncultured Bradyrhizobium sp.]|uniref:hypothetical protein n=1 Tax=uncultured Bradyrhizobium sp. TaxID=199684 RepID=UPI0035CB5FD1